MDNPYRTYEDSPDGRTRVQFDAVPWLMSHESMVPTVVDVHTGRTLVSFDDLHWDGKVDWTDKGLVLQMRYYPGSSGVWSINVDRTNDTFEVNGHSGPLQELVATMAKLHEGASPRRSLWSRWFLGQG